MWPLHNNILAEITLKSDHGIRSGIILCENSCTALYSAIGAVGNDKAKQTFFPTSNN